jgi:hypothetical protein
MRCIDCGAEIIFGKPHELQVTEADGVTHTEIRCDSCSVDLAWAFWSEDWGPFPHQRHQAGNA